MGRRAEDEKARRQTCSCRSRWDGSCGCRGCICCLGDTSIGDLSAPAWMSFDTKAAEMREEGGKEAIKSRIGLKWPKQKLESDWSWDDLTLTFADEGKAFLPINKRKGPMEVVFATIERDGITSFTSHVACLRAKLIMTKGGKENARSSSIAPAYDFDITTMLI